MVRILFVHPDLGIGGAEKLVVDAALALQLKGHIVSFITNHHDISHCFEETRNGTLSIQTVGDWLPRKMFGCFYAFWAYIRMLYASLYISLILSRREKLDIIFCDLISVGIPILKLCKCTPKVIYYCHFPDQLLSNKGSYIKALYRIPLNFLEEITIGQADHILVNSKFTQRIFKKTFKKLSITPEILYPCVNTNFFDEAALSIDDNEILLNIPDDAFIFLSINRYERKKKLQLAIKAFNALQKVLHHTEWEKLFLILAGGYDTRVNENVEYYTELETLAKKLCIQSRVLLIRSPSDLQKIFLLKRAKCLLYTPENEHFGIVPLEAMYLSKPVIAVNNGGPTETIIHQSTGLLCEQNEIIFCEAMKQLVRDPFNLETMGKKGRKHVQQKFSFDSFSYKLNYIILKTIGIRTKDK